MAKPNSSLNHNFIPPPSDVYENSEAEVEHYRQWIPQLLSQIQALQEEKQEAQEKNFLQAQNINNAADNANDSVNGEVQQLDTSSQQNDLIKNLFYNTKDISKLLPLHSEIDEFVSKKKEEEKLQQSIEALHKLIKDEKEKRIEAENQYLEATAKESNAQSRITILQHRIDCYNKRLDQFQTERDAEKTELNETLVNLQRKARQDQKELRELQNRFEDNEEDLKNCREQREKSFKTIDNLQNQLLEIRTISEQQIQNLVKRLQLKEKMASLQEQWSETHAVHLKELSEQAEMWTDEKAALQKEVQTLKSQLAGSTQHPEMAIAKIFGESKANDSIIATSEQVKKRVLELLGDQPNLTTNETVMSIVLDLENKMNECTVLRQKYFESQAALSSVNSKYDASFNTCQSLQSEITMLKSHNASLTKQVEKAMLIHVSIQEKFDTFVHDNENLKCQNANLTRRNSELVNALAVKIYDKECDKGSDSNVDFKSLEELVNANNALKLSLSRLVELKETESQIAIKKLEKDLQEYKEKLANLTSERDKFADESFKIINNLKEERSMLEKEIQTVTGKNIQAVKFAGKDKEREQEIQDSSQDSQTLAVLNTRLKDTQKRCESLQNELRQLKEENARIEKNSAVLKASLDFYKSKCESLNSELDRSQQNILELNKKVYALKEGVSVRKENSEALNDALDCERRRIETLQQEIEQLNTKLRLEKTIVAEVESEKNSISRENEQRCRLLMDSIAAEKVALQLQEERLKSLVDSHHKDAQQYQDQISQLNDRNRQEIYRRAQIEEKLQENLIDTDSIKQLNSELKVRLSVATVQLEERTKQVEFLKCHQMALPINILAQNKTSDLENVENGTPISSVAISTEVDDRMEKLKAELNDALVIQEHWKALCKELQNQIKSKEEIFSKMQEKASEFDATVQQQDSALKEVQNNFETQLKENLILKEENNLLKEHKLNNDEIERLKTNILELEDKIKLLNNQNCRMSQQIEEHSHEMHRQVRLHMKDIDQLNVLEKSSDELKKNLENERSIRIKVENAMNTEKMKAKVEIDNLTCKNSDFQAEIMRLRHDLTNLHGIVKDQVIVGSITDENLKKRYDAVEFQRQCLENRIEELRLELLQSNNEVKSLTRTLAETKELFENERSRYKDVEIELKNNKLSLHQIAENATLRNTAKHLRLELDAIETNYQELSSRLHKEMQTLEPLNLQLKKQEAENKQLVKELTSAKNSVLCWEQTYNRLAESLNGLDRGKFELLEKDVTKLKDQAADLERANENLQIELADKISKLEIVDVKLLEASAELDTLRQCQTELDVVRSERESLRSVIELSAKECAELKDLNSRITLQLEASREQTQNKDAIMTKSNQALRQKLELVQKQLHQMHDTSTKNEGPKGQSVAIQTYNCASSMSGICNPDEVQSILCRAGKLIILQNLAVMHSMKETANVGNMTIEQNQRQKLSDAAAAASHAKIENLTKEKEEQVARAMDLLQQLEESNKRVEELKTITAEYETNLQNDITRMHQRFDSKIIDANSSNSLDLQQNEENGDNIQQFCDEIDRLRQQRDLLCRKLKDCDLLDESLLVDFSSPSDSDFDHRNTDQFETAEKEDSATGLVEDATCDNARKRVYIETVDGVAFDEMDQSRIKISRHDSDVKDTNLKYETLKNYSSPTYFEGHIQEHGHDAGAATLPNQDKNNKDDSIFSAQQVTDHLRECDTFDASLSMQSDHQTDEYRKTPSVEASSEAANLDLTYFDLNESMEKNTTVPYTNQNNSAELMNHNMRLNNTEISGMYASELDSNYSKEIEDSNKAATVYSDIVSSSSPHDEDWSMEVGTSDPPEGESQVSDGASLDEIYEKGAKQQENDKEDLFDEEINFDSPNTDDASHDNAVQ